MNLREREGEREREREQNERDFQVETKLVSICSEDFSCARRIKYYSWTPDGEIETIHTWNLYLPVG